MQHGFPLPLGCLRALLTNKVTFRLPNVANLVQEGCLASNYIRALHAFPYHDMISCYNRILLVPLVVLNIGQNEICGSDHLQVHVSKSFPRGTLYHFALTICNNSLDSFNRHHLSPNLNMICANQIYCYALAPTTMNRLPAYELLKRYVIGTPSISSANFPYKSNCVHSGFR